MADFDIAIIGGGLNGTCIARDAAGRGLRVVIIEQNDLASGAAAAAPHLMHGDFFDLEHGLALRVRRALMERNIAIKNAPHVVQPTRFVIPDHIQGRPSAIVRAGLHLYQRLASGIFMDGPVTRDLTIDPMGHPLKRAFILAFEHSDCVVDESRLVVLNARDAAERGATVLTGARCARVDRGTAWKLAVINRGHREIVTADVLVNATGAWNNMVSETILHLPTLDVNMTRVSQIVVKRIADHNSVYVFQNTDRHLIYAIPFQRDFTLIGSIGRDFAGDPNTVSATSDDVGYLCSGVNLYLREQIQPADVVHAISAAQVKRAAKYVRWQGDGIMRLDRKNADAPLLTLLGGTTTTARRRAELVMTRLSQYFTMKPAWTSLAPLPGGDFPASKIDDLVDDMLYRWQFLSPRHARRLAESYGTRVNIILSDAKGMNDLGTLFGEDLTGAEVRYLMTVEWARFADDILWRRSKLGLSMPAHDKEALSAFMADFAAKLSQVQS